MLERLILDRLSGYITTMTIRFKPRHSTDQCIYAVKGVVESYRRQGSTMHIGFIDAPKPFDRVNHNKQFNELKLWGVPSSLVGILAYWYTNQSMRVKCGSILSSPFKVSNRVRQGGILSPALFNDYMDDLSRQWGCAEQVVW